MEDTTNMKDTTEISPSKKRGWFIPPPKTPPPLNLTPQQQRSHEKALINAGPFWESTEMMKLFPSTEISVTSADVTLISYIDHLHLNTDPNFLQKLIESPYRKHKINTKQALKMQHQCVMLRCCYITTLLEMPKGKRWTECIKNAFSKMTQIGLEVYKDPKPIYLLHKHFRQKLTLPHPNKMIQSGKLNTPRLFSLYPEAKELFFKFCSDNLETLSCESSSQYVKSTLLPTVYHISQQEANNLSIEAFKHSLKLSTIHPSTMGHWLQYIVFQYK